MMISTSGREQSGNPTCLPACGGVAKARETGRRETWIRGLILHPRHINIVKVHRANCALLTFVVS